MKRYLLYKNIILSICIFIIFVPFMQKGIRIGDDYAYQLCRIQSLADALKQHLFPLRIHATMLNLYGYGTGFFYSDFFLFLPAYLIAHMGLTLSTAYKFFILCTIVFFVYGSHYCFKYMLKNEWVALIPTITVCVSHYVLINLYFRFALGEYLGFLFVPFILAGMYSLIYENYTKSHFLVLGACGVILSHVIMTVMISTFCFFFLLIHIRKVLKPEKLTRLLRDFSLILLLTSFYWIPMLEQMSSQKFDYSIPWTYASRHIMTFQYLMGEKRFSAGLVTDLLMFSVPFVMVVFRIRNRKAVAFYLSGMAVIFSNLCYPFWAIADKIFNIQFCWRVLGIGVILIGIGAAFVLKDLWDRINSPGRRRLFLELAVTLLLFMTLYSNYLEFQDDTLPSQKVVDFSKVNIYQSGTILGIGKEYLPVSCNKDSFIHPYNAIDQWGQSYPGMKKGLRYSVQVSKSGFYEIPYIWYKGYQGSITDSSGKTAKVTVTENKHGFASVYVSNPKGGTIHVWYQSTPATIFSELISISTSLMLLLYLTALKLLPMCLGSKRTQPA